MFMTTARGIQGNPSRGQCVLHIFGIHSGHV